LAVPLLAATVNDPVELPLQATLVCAVMPAVKLHGGGGALAVTLTVILQLVPVEKSVETSTL